MNYRTRQDAADEVVERVVQAGGEAFAWQADVSLEDQVLGMFDEVTKRWGRLDALVNNAGILQLQSRFEDVELERFQSLLQVNVVSVFLCCREAVRRMARGGAIVNVGSVASRLGAAGEYVDYAATKGAMDSITIGLAKEVASRGIRVNGVRPGYIETEIHADGGEPGRVARLAPQLPLGRGGTPADVAHAIAWLLSEESSFTTGSFIEVAGGR